MLSQQEISDRFEIQDLVFRYSDIIDQRDFDLLRTEVFTTTRSLIILLWVVCRVMLNLRSHF